MAEGLLAGKRGVVFGVANEKSIAWACAEACAAAGASLAFNFLGDAQHKRVAKLLESLPGAIMFPCDVSKDDEIDAFFASIKNEWDGIDFLIHSVAYADRNDLKNPFIETPRDHFAMALDISAYSLVALARAARPLFTQGGSIVAMTYYGAEKVIPNYNVMGVAKAALECNMRYLADNLGPDNIRVNCISAGPLRTLSASAIPGLKDMFSVTEQVSPLRRNVTTEEVGKTTLYLVSDLASGVTGEVLHVDCGYNILGMFGGYEK
jgi:enoyl-[acyl-carrier protein] reductase I